MNSSTIPKGRADPVPNWRGWLALSTDNPDLPWLDTGHQVAEAILADDLGVKGEHGRLDVSSGHQPILHDLEKLLTHIALVGIAHLQTLV